MALRGRLTYEDRDARGAHHGPEPQRFHEEGLNLAKAEISAK